MESDGNVSVLCVVVCGAGTLLKTTNVIGFFQNRVLVSVLSVDTAVFRVEPKLG